MKTTEEEEIVYNRKLEALRHDWHSLRYKHLGKEQLTEVISATPLERLAKRSRKENMLFGFNVLITVIVMIAINAFGSWYTPIPAAWVALLLIDDYVGFRYVYFLPPADSVSMTLRTALRALRRLRVMYALAPVMIWVVITMMSALLPNNGRAWIVALELIPLLALVCVVTWRIWTRRIEVIHERMRLFEE